MSVTTFDEANLEELATKADLKELRAENREMELRINAQLTLLKWMIGIVLAGVVSLVVKTFFP